jgi:hypothetical protein
VAPHGGKDEWLSSVFLQPAAHGGHNFLQAGNTTAPHGNSDALAVQLFGGNAKSI